MKQLFISLELDVFLHKVLARMRARGYLKGFFFFLLFSSSSLFIIFENLFSN